MDGFKVFICSVYQAQNFFKLGLGPKLPKKKKQFGKVNISFIRDITKKKVKLVLQRE